MHPLIRSIVGSKDKENRVPCSQVVYSPMGETSKHKLWVTIWPCKFNNRNVKKHSELLSCTWERESTWCTRTSAWPGRWRKFMQESVLDLKLTLETNGWQMSQPNRPHLQMVGCTSSSENLSAGWMDFQLTPGLKNKWPYPMCMYNSRWMEEVS